MNSRIEKVNLICEVCGISIKRYQCQIKNNTFGTFCSQKCLWEKRRSGKKYICTNCGKKFYRRDGEQAKNKPTSKIYCTKKCYFIDRARNRKESTYQKIGTRHAHRAIMEKIIGRKLKPTEIVHHINGNQQDNRKENLILLHSQSDHAKLHRNNMTNKFSKIKEATA